MMSSSHDSSYEALAESKSSNEHRLQVSDPDEDSDGNSKRGALSVQEPPSDSPSANPPRRWSKKKKLAAYIFSALLLALVAFVIAVIVDLALVRPQMSVAPSDVKVSDRVTLKGAASFANPPHLSTIRVKSATCELYGTAGRFASATLEDADLSTSFPLHAQLHSVDIAAFSSMLDELLAARNGGPSATSRINALCSASVKMSDKLFGISYTHDVSTVSSLQMKDLWSVADGSSDGGSVVVDWLDVKVDGGLQVSMAEFKYLVAAQASIDTGNAPSKLGCYAVRSDAFSYTTKWVGVNEAVSDLSNAWSHALEWRREDCQDTCRDGIPLGADQPSDVAALTACSDSNHIISNLLGDHHVRMQFNSSSALHLQVHDTIQQHSSPELRVSPRISTYTPAHVSYTAGSAQVDRLDAVQEAVPTMGRMSFVPPSMVVALGFDASLTGNYSYSITSAKLANVQGVLALSIAQPNGFSLLSALDFGFLVDFVDPVAGLNVTADFISLYEPSSGSAITHYAGGVLASGFLDRDEQSLTLNASLAFDANGRQFSFPTQYSANLFGQYSRIVDSSTVIRVDVNGDVAWSDTVQTAFAGAFILDETYQTATLAFAEQPGSSGLRHKRAASADRTALSAFCTYTLATSPLLQFTISNGVGALTTNYSPRSVQTFSAALLSTRSATGDWPFALNFTVTERAPSDSATVARVKVVQSVALQVYLQSQSTLSFGANGTIVANYNFLTQYQSQFVLNTNKGNVQLAFYEGGAADFPAVANVSPRTSYAFTSPLLYSFSWVSSPVFINLNVNAAGQLIYGRVLQSVHSISLTFNVQEDPQSLLHLYFFTSAIDRFGSDAPATCRNCLHQTTTGTVPMSASGLSSTPAVLASSGDVSGNYVFLSAWQLNGQVDSSTVIVAFVEGGVNDYPRVPGATPRTEFSTTPFIIYSFSSTGGVQLWVNGTSSLLYSYSQLSQQSISVGVGYSSGSATPLQVDITMREHYAPDAPSVNRVFIDEHLSYSNSNDFLGVNTVAIASVGTLIINYNMYTSYTGQFTLNSQNQYKEGSVQLKFYEGGAKDFPTVPSAMPRTSYTLTSPFLYSFASQRSPLQVSLTVNCAGQLIYSRSVQSVHSLSNTFTLMENQPSLATLYFVTSLSERSGNDAPGVCRVCVDHTTSGSFPMSANTYSHGSASLSSHGSVTANYNFLTSFTLQSAANGVQQLVTLQFDEGGVNDYPNVPTGTPRTAYHLTPSATYNYNSDSTGLSLTASGSGQLTFSRKIQSVHDVSFNFAYTMNPSGQFGVTVNERAWQDLPTAPRVLVDHRMSFNWLNSVASGSSDGSIIGNYNFLTSYIADGTVDTTQHTIQLDFYEGGQSDFPKNPAAAPRTAYLLSPLKWTYSYQSSPLQLSFGIDGAGQLTFGRQIQSVHSITLSLIVAQALPQLASFELTTNVAERSGSDPSTSQRVSIKHTTTAAIPTTSDAFNSGVASVSSAGKVIILYNFQSGFTLTASADGSQQAVTVAFAEGGLNDGPNLPGQPPRSAFNLKGTYTFSSSPLIITSTGSGDLTYSRQLQSIYDYTFLFDNDQQTFSITVHASSPSDSLHSAHRVNYALTPLSSTLSIVSTRDFAPTASIEASMQIDCEQRSVHMRSNVEHYLGCAAVSQWEQFGSASTVLCHMQTDRSADAQLCAPVEGPMQ